MGTDTYVKSVINSYLHKLVKYAYKIFGRTQCKLSENRYGIVKCSEHIRKMYLENTLLIGIDDRVNEMMDDGYDLRISVEPYKVKNQNDQELIGVIEKIINFCVTKNNV
ncbi:nuclear lim interactor-interacting [Caerostris extrusa]|uniref:Nuclear lim interactor-interacting n=1 Tax=Caerostris extrusa TaxID=172846 RepID=A0AAV4VU75_CAEEX|nr:nuclear lim interactor-interacting [Caerostris extrusa]